MNRNLDCYRFRVCRNNLWQSVCWSDLTIEERNKQLENRTMEWLKALCIGLGTEIKNIGDELDLVRVYEGEDNYEQ